MKYVNLSGMNMSQIVLGTDGYAERIDKSTAFEIMDLYIQNSGNVIDTARLYCNGMSESYVGEFIRGIRENLYISTKCSHPPLSDMSKSRLRESDIEWDIDASLKTMGIDYIDIIWLHRDDKTKPVGPIIDALNKMVKKEKIRHFGASNWSYDRISEANEYARKTAQIGFIASQSLYNMAVRTSVWDDTLVCIEGEEKEKYDNSHFPVFAFSSQAKGFFEKYATNSLSPKAIDRYLNDDTLKIYENICSRAKAENSTISATALNMLIEQSNFDVFPIIGPSNANQLKTTLNIK